MTGSELFMLVFAILGGLALFILGMTTMTEGLRLAAGRGLRAILARTGRSLLAGSALGTVMGTLVHSSATTVMLVGFVNAGLMTLPETIPAVLGANLGTTLSMQAVSFDLSAYCYVAITLGLILRMASPNERLRHVGQSLLGFGLLFLGMETMSAAVKPHRAVLEPILASVNGTTPRGFALSLLISLTLTAVWQSSGATIGICFALARAGVFTELPQVYPIILGAHIGTCATGLLGSIGTNVEARRTAIGHLLFNILNVVVAVIAQRLFLLYIPTTSDDLVRQIANTHTLVIGTTALLLLPLSGPFAKLLRIVWPSRAPLPERSFLDSRLLKRPENAIAASIRELHRMARMCRRSYGMLGNIMLFDFKGKGVQTIRQNELVLNEIKKAVRDYLAAMTRRYLSRRQSMLLQYIDRCMTELERIGDHIDAACALSLKRRKIKEARFERDCLERLFALYRHGERVLDLLVISLAAESDDARRDASEAILVERVAFVERSEETKAHFAERVKEHVEPAIGAIYQAEYVAAFDRLVDHVRTIALLERRPDFHIKARKLERVAKRAPRRIPPNLVDAGEFLRQLRDGEEI